MHTFHGWLICALQHGVNMNTGLTTFDGFPRSDIDVPQSMCHRGYNTKRVLTHEQYERLERASYV